MEQANMSFIVLNIPHSSVYIAERYREKILLSDEDLKKELDLLTDIDVDEIFVGYDRVVAENSRLVCDVERFLSDEQEEMSKMGMGAVYIKACSGKDLRKQDDVLRKEIIEEVYIPYHNKLRELVDAKLQEHKKCLIVDCHSYSEELPYITGGDVDICLGVDDYHTKEMTWKVLHDRLTDNGFKVCVNRPFSGSIVPLEYYGTDNNVNSIMIEINKRIYIKDGKSDYKKVVSLRKMFNGILSELEKTV